MWPDLKSDGFERVVNVDGVRLRPHGIDRLLHLLGPEQVVSSVQTLHVGVANTCKQTDCKTIQPLCADMLSQLFT